MRFVRYDEKVYHLHIAAIHTSSSEGLATSCVGEKHLDSVWRTYWIYNRLRELYRSDQQLREVDGCDASMVFGSDIQLHIRATMAVAVKDYFEVMDIILEHKRAYSKHDYVMSSVCYVRLLPLEVEQTVIIIEDIIIRHKKTKEDLR